MCASFRESDDRPRGCAALLFPRPRGGWRGRGSSGSDPAGWPNTPALTAPSWPTVRRDAPSPLAAGVRTVCRRAGGVVASGVSSPHGLRIHRGRDPAPGPRGEGEETRKPPRPCRGRSLIVGGEPAVGDEEGRVRRPNPGGGSCCAGRGVGRSPAGLDGRMGERCLLGSAPLRA